MKADSKHLTGRALPHDDDVRLARNAYHFSEFFTAFGITASSRRLWTRSRGVGRDYDFANVFLQAGWLR